MFVLIQRFASTEREEFISKSRGNFCETLYRSRAKRVLRFDQFKAPLFFLKNIALRHLLHFFFFFFTFNSFKSTFVANSLYNIGLASCITKSNHGIAKIMITTMVDDNIIFSLARTGNSELLRFAVILPDRFLATDHAGHIGKC